MVDSTRRRYPATRWRETEAPVVELADEFARHLVRRGVPDRHQLINARADLVRRGINGDALRHPSDVERRADQDGVELVETWASSRVALEIDDGDVTPVIGQAPTDVGGDRTSLAAEPGDT